MKKACSLTFLFLFFFLCVPITFAAERDHLLLINLATNQLSFFEDGNYVRTFPVTTGSMNTPTPEGTFCVINKYKNKAYHRKNIPGGSPNNPLGTRWMGINKNQYGIHGTNREWSIGSRKSNGCIRMYNRDIEWLYERTPLQTKVIIAHFHTSPEYAAHQFGYRVVSWNGHALEEEQIGKITTIDQTKIYWQEPNGQFTEIKTVLPNEVYPVYSQGKNGLYYVGNNLYIMDEKERTVRYEQIPYSVLSNIYKRKYEVE